MNPTDFIYWLQGYFELTEEGTGLSPSQVQVIKDHIKLVLKKETPDVKISVKDPVHQPINIKEIIEQQKSKFPEDVDPWRIGGPYRPLVLTC